MLINEVSKLTGVSVRTLHYYDQIGLLHPSEITDSNYRLYDDTALERLQQILFFRELKFPLKEIERILDSPDFDKNKALKQQVTLLTMQKEHLEQLITLAKGIQTKGEKKMDFKAFDTTKMDEYAKEAKESWGSTPEYKEYESKHSKNANNSDITKVFMQLFAELGSKKNLPASSSEVQEQVKKIQDYITANYYHCTNEIFASLGEMYTADERFMNNIDSVGGAGTAAFAQEAIRIYVGK